MTKEEFRREEGIALFYETLPVIKDYILQRKIKNEDFPSIDMVVADVDYVGNQLIAFIRGIEKYAPITAAVYVWRLQEELRVAKMEYEGAESA